MSSPGPATVAGVSPTFRPSVLSAVVASSALLLDLARAAQGAAAAVVTAGGLAVLASIYPPAERGRALGVSAAIAALS